MEQSIEAQEAFKRDWLADPEDPEVFANLEAALGFQRKLKAIDPDDAFGSSARLSELMQLLKATKGQSLYTEGRINGEKAVELVARGDSISAIPLLEKALSNQEWINANLRDSSLVDLGEVARLRQWLASLETVDAVAEVDRYYEEGKVAYAAKDWDLGEVLFDRAISIQESINLNMPESSHVRWRLIQELKDYQRRIDAGRMNQRVEELISASKREDPSDNLERAMNLQSLLNERYSATEYLNPERLEFLKSELATDLSEANSGLLIEQSERLTQLIRKKDWPGAQVALLELEGVILEFIDRFSEALLPDPQLKSRVNWLIAMDSQLAGLVASIEERLVDHPTDNVRLFASEVDQNLYEVVMKSNPSRWTGEDNPVDSVTFAEASEFCKRLGWALGRPVVLPRLNWLSYLTESASDGGDFWFAHNSRFQSQPVRTSHSILGLYDVFGNLAEWVTEGDGIHVAGLFGGSGADTWSTIRGKPLNRVAENFRSRWVGFRFCVLG